MYVCNTVSHGESWSLPVSMLWATSHISRRNDRKNNVITVIIRNILSVHLIFALAAIFSAAA